MSRDGKTFQVQGTVTWVGDDAVRPRGSTGKVRQVSRTRVYVSWGYERDVPRDQQPDAEVWVAREDVLPGFVPEDELPFFRRAS